MTITSRSLRRARSSFAVAGLAVLLAGPLGGCVIEAKIGDDPEGGSDTGETEAAESDGTGSPGYTSGAEPGTASATTTTSTTGANPGSASFTTAGEDTATAGDTEPGVDVDTALELCGVMVVPPEPGDPIYQDGIMCADGCLVFVESAEPTNLLEQGDCVCAAMECGPLTGGTTGMPGGSSTDTDGGDPDGCGPFPAGEAGFTCACEMCSIDVTNVDPAWLEGEADLPTICECMCGGAGCGSPL